MKSKILELMYSWTLGLPHEVKILEAYQMLKKQGERLEGGWKSCSPSLFVRAGSKPGCVCAQTQHVHRSAWLCSRDWQRKGSPAGLLAGQGGLLVV